MKEKNIVDVIIAGERYRLCGYETTEYIHRVAAYVNSKFDEIEAMKLHLNSEKKNVLINLTITDELFKANEELDQLKQEREETDKKLFNLKHELATIKDALDKETEKNRSLNEQLNRFRRR